MIKYILFDLALLATPASAQTFPTPTFGSLTTSKTGGTSGNVTAAGNVGIGTASPAYSLDVVGTINSNNLILNSVSQSPYTAAALFGTGADGAVTISSGTTTLTRDMQYTNLTINGSGKINPNGWRIYVSGTLDLTAAPASAITRNTIAGNNATGATGGAYQGNSYGFTVPGSTYAGGASLGSGGTGNTTTGTNGTAGGNSVPPANGGAGGNSGNYQIVVLNPATFTVGSFNQSGTAGGTTVTSTGASGGAGATVRGNL